jgi:hypothetical protein
MLSPSVSFAACTSYSSSSVSFCASCVFAEKLKKEENRIECHRKSVGQKQERRKIG